MSDGRTVPRPMQRQLKEEAGYRCSIPTCKGTSALELAHIVPWSKVKEHTFENIIVLCAVCHTRYDHKEIPRASIEQFKRNLSLLTHRYSQMEYRALTFFASNLDDYYLVTALDTFVFSNLIDDGHLKPQMGGGMVHVQVIGGKEYEVPGYWIYELTDSGVDLVNSMINADAID